MGKILNIYFKGKFCFGGGGIFSIGGNLKSLLKGYFFVGRKTFFDRAVNVEVGVFTKHLWIQKIKFRCKLQIFDGILKN